MPDRETETGHLPRFAAEEAASGRRYPRVLQLPEHAVSLRYRISRAYSIADIKDAVLKREFFAWVMSGRQRIGALEMYEFCPNGCGSAEIDCNDDFIYIMDLEYAEEAELSVVLSSSWQDIALDVTHAGPIVELRWAWIDRDYSGSGLVTTIIETVMAKLFAHHSILVMKVWPLQLRRRSAAGCSVERESRRLRALERHCRRELGMERLPGPYWRDGWLWRPNPARGRFIAAPRTGSIITLPPAGRGAR